MRLPLLALLCAGTAAFCQSPAAPKVDPDNLFRMPDRYSESSTNLRKPAVDQKFSIDSIKPALHMTVITPGPVVPGPNFNSSQIDPKIIMRPPWPTEADQPRGQDVSRNLYPNLKLLPIHRGQPIR